MPGPNATADVQPTPNQGLDALVDGVLARPDAGAGAVDDDEVAEALVDAARAMVEDVGIRRLRMDDVARQAGYGRATLYRRFATRDDLVWAVLTREVQRTLVEISRQIADIPALEDRVVEAFAVTVERTRGNRLLSRLLQIEPDLLLPHLTTRGVGALAFARRLMARLLQEGKSRGDLRGVDTELAAELMVRLAHSMLLCPEGPVDVDDPQALRRFARTTLAEPLFAWSRP